MHSHHNQHHNEHRHALRHEHQQGDATHPHHYQSRSRKAMFFALLLTGGFGLLEFAGGVWSGSLALISDAGHMATDAAALFLAWVALWFVRRPASEKLSFGYLRAEVLAAFVNALAMGVLIGAICWEAVLRLQAPHPVAGKTVLVIAAVGFLINLLVLWVLQDKQTSENASATELNRRAAVLHVMGDLLGSVAAMISGAVVMWTGWVWIDPLLSLFVCVLLARSTWDLLRESTLVLMEGVPQGIDYSAVGDALQAIPGVVGVHDLHIWSMAPAQPALSAHVKVLDMAQWVEILNISQNLLRQRFGIDHMTLQPEAAASCSSSCASGNRV